MANLHMLISKWLMFTLHLFIRGEITRRKHGVLMKSSMTIYSKKLEEIHAIILQRSGAYCLALFSVLTFGL
jgi:hypothetical protein